MIYRVTTLYSGRLCACIETDGNIVLLKKMVRAAIYLYGCNMWDYHVEA